MIKISFEDFEKHWAPNKDTRRLGNRLTYNVFDFTTLVGNYSKRYFTTSFMTSGFYKSGKTWPSRTSKWGTKFTHPTMFDTGTLRKFIKGEQRNITLTQSAQRGKKIFRRGAKYFISTEEQSLPIKGKRGKSGKKNPKGRYAAIHNTDPRFTPFTVNQYSNRKPVQRQFIGFNDKLDKDIEKFIPLIFKGFPNA